MTEHTPLRNQPDTAESALTAHDAQHMSFVESEDTQDILAVVSRYVEETLHPLRELESREESLQAALKKLEELDVASLFEGFGPVFQPQACELMFRVGEELAKGDANIALHALGPIYRECLSRYIQNQTGVQQVNLNLSVVQATLNKRENNESCFKVELAEENLLTDQLAWVVQSGGQFFLHQSESRDGDIKFLDVSAPGLSDLLFRTVESQASAVAAESGNPLKKETVLVMQALLVMYYGSVLQGVLSAAVDYSYEYANSRKASGKVIIQHQAITLRAGNMITQLTAARLGLMSLLTAIAEGVVSVELVRSCRQQLLESAVFISKESVQILAGWGYVEVYPLAKWYRDSIMLRHLLNNIPLEYDSINISQAEDHK